MALFGSGRDASLIRHINKELMQKFISIEVAYYKLSLPDTSLNIYNESSQKIYYNPIRVAALIMKENKTATDTDFGIDFTKTIKFAFLRDDLLDLNLVCDEGDIIKFDSFFYEVDNVTSQQYWAGRNPDTLIAFVERDVPEYGYSVSVICETHQTRLSSVQTVDVRVGIENPINNRKDFKLL